MSPSGESGAGGGAEAWYHIDDETVTAVKDLEAMQGSSAYMLFYRQRGM
eukprot:CAMPEP_0167788998 /NCGR_PEP_ID=MMETSP0111_2-20121227/10404_1 /TAXON_ID=91324 /ORGANISM="Lotharella globosa, Strain CCCM811" /LENGTH=48 /DNA_ID= /DNA_START= /DNA_END= /DNA_ORIENTATION=